jgi:hypothetical protein
MLLRCKKGDLSGRKCPNWGRDVRAN